MSEMSKSYMLDSSDVEIIENKSQEMGNASASAALRTIIREWYAMKNNGTPIFQATRPSASTTYPAIPFGG